MKKKIVPILIVGVLLLVAGAFIGWQMLNPKTGVSGAFEYKLLWNGSAEITAYTGNEDHVVVPQIIDGHTVKSIGAKAFWYDNGDFWHVSDAPIKSITLPDTVTSIGEGAFYGCANMTSINIPEGVNAIGSHAFYECGLTSVVIPKGVTTIAPYAFAYCEALTDVELPDTIRTIGENAFSGCYRLTEMELPDKLSTIGEFAFSVTGLTGVDIPVGVSNIGTMAFAYSDLTSVRIPDETTGLGENPFAYCEQLTDIQVSANHPTLKVVDGVLFEKVEKKLVCYPAGLTATAYDVTLDTAAIGAEAFSGSKYLTSVKLPASVKKIGEVAFGSCPNLTLKVAPGSVAKQYAVNNNIPYEDIE